MRFPDSAVDASREENGVKTEVYPMTYIHPSGQETRYDLQEFTYSDDRQPMYVVSESRLNEGPGFDSMPTRDMVAHQAAEAAKMLNNPELFPEAQREISTSEVRLYQQRPDGDFDRVHFRDIGRDGQSEANLERQEAQPELYPSERPEASAQSPQMTEYGRDVFSREHVEEAGGRTLEAPTQTRQQYAEMQNEQWRDLSGPAIDRNTEQTAQARSQEQNMQMNEHQQEHYHSQEF